MPLRQLLLTVRFHVSFRVSEPASLHAAHEAAVKKAAEASRLVPPGDVAGGAVVVKKGKLEIGDAQDVPYASAPLGA